LKLRQQLLFTTGSLREAMGHQDQEESDELGADEGAVVALEVPQCVEQEVSTTMADAFRQRRATEA